MPTPSQRHINKDKPPFTVLLPPVSGGSMSSIRHKNPFGDEVVSKTIRPLPAEGNINHRRDRPNSRPDIRSVSCKLHASPKPSKDIQDTKTLKLTADLQTPSRLPKSVSHPINFHKRSSPTILIETPPLFPSELETSEEPKMTKHANRSGSGNSQRHSNRNNKQKSQNNTKPTSSGRSKHKSASSIMPTNGLPAEDSSGYYTDKKYYKSRDKRDRDDNRERDNITVKSRSNNTTPNRYHENRSSKKYVQVLHSEEISIGSPPSTFVSEESIIELPLKSQKSQRTSQRLRNDSEHQQPKQRKSSKNRNVEKETEKSPKRRKDRHNKQAKAQTSASNPIDFKKVSFGTIKNEIKKHLSSTNSTSPDEGKKRKSKNHRRSEVSYSDRSFESKRSKHHEKDNFRHRSTTSSETSESSSVTPKSYRKGKKSRCHDVSSSDELDSSSSESSNSERDTESTSLSSKRSSKKSTPPKRMTVVEYANTTTFHGCSNFLTESKCNIRKLFWAWIFIGALAYCSYSAWNRVVYFFKYPHITKIDEIDLQEEPGAAEKPRPPPKVVDGRQPNADKSFTSAEFADNRKQMVFPAITICNLNMFKVQFLTQADWRYTAHSMFDIIDADGNFILPDSVTKYFNGVAAKRLLAAVEQFRADIKKNKNEKRKRKKRGAKPFKKPVESATPTLINEKGKIPDLLKYPKLNGWNMLDFINRTGFTLSDMVLECSYRGVDCKDGLFWDSIFTRYGKCYTFNGGKKIEPLKTLKGGMDNGLELMLDVQSNEYMPVWEKTDETATEMGFKIQIHEQNEPPLITELGFAISPGSQTLVTTKEQQIKFLSEPYGKCISTDSPIPGFEIEFPKYSISACRITCEAKFINSYCGCKMVHMPVSFNVSYCMPEEYKICADLALDYLVKEDNSACVCGTGAWG